VHGPRIRLIDLSAVSIRGIPINPIQREGILSDDEHGFLPPTPDKGTPTAPAALRPGVTGSCCSRQPCSSRT